MWDIALKKRHTTDIAKVRGGVKKLVSKVKKEYGIHGEWSDPGNFIAEEGGHVEEGRIVVSDTTVTINIRFDFLGKLAKGKIRDAIEKELDKIL